MRQRWLPIAIGVLIVALIAAAVIYTRSGTDAPETASALQAPSGASSPVPGASPAASQSPMPDATLSPAPIPSSNPNPDLAIDESGLSHATAILTTTKGVIKFKFYPQDAPNTVKRIIELATKGFYNGLIWHRVKPGFVIQGGDPQGNGTGGSGQKLKAEFNDRRHIEGTVAMARGSDPDSADSQFYISLGVFPHLDHSYTVFGQVIEGMDTARKIQVGDKIVSLVIQ